MKKTVKVLLAIVIFITGISASIFLHTRIVQFYFDAGIVQPISRQLSASWLNVIRTNQVPRWELLDVQYLDPQQAQGNVNIYVTLLDSDGTPAQGITVYLDTGVPADRTWQITKSGGTSDFPQTADSSFDPSRGERGPYNVYIGGLSSDIVTGMGLPLKQHVVYLLKFKKIIAPPVTPSPSITPIPGGLTEDDIRRIINDVMREKFR